MRLTIRLLPSPSDRSDDSDKEASDGSGQEDDFDITDSSPERGGCR